MSGLLSFVGKKVLAESARNKFGQEDPYFEEIPASRLNRAVGKKKQRRRKANPPGLSEHDEHILTQVKRRAYRLDYALFSLCGVRFGWGSVIALIPFAGDAADTGLSMMVVKKCEEIDGGLPSRLRMMMMLNVLFDFLIGLVPFAGDMADAVFKCNTRNAIILEKHLREKGAKALAKQKKQRRQDAPPEPTAVDPSLPDEWDRYDDPPSYDQAQNADVTRPAPARHANRSQRGWFGGGSRRPTNDLETGVVDHSHTAGRR